MLTVALVGCVLLCGLGYRCRGGLLAPWHVPGQLARLTFALAAALTAYVAGAPWHLALILIPAWFAGETLPLWDSIDLGANEGTFYGDFRTLALRGALGAFLPAWALQVAGYDGLALLTAGLLMAPAYVAGRALRVTLPGLGTAVDYPPRGEALAGALYGLGTIAAVTL